MRVNDIEKNIIIIYRKISDFEKKIFHRFLLRCFEYDIESSRNNKKQKFNVLNGGYNEVQ